MENENCNIGQRIYDLRIEHDIQQGELARAIHLHQSVLNRIERGLRPALLASFWFVLWASLRFAFFGASPLMKKH